MYNIEESKERIAQVLKSFKIGHSDITYTAGPTVTLFEFYPQIGVRMSKVANLKNEFASALRTTGVRVIAPTDNGTIGIEVPNAERKNVSMMELLYSDEYMNTNMELPLVIGRKVDNSVFMVDLATMPHLLVAGATGMGKSVGLNVIITSLLRKKSPDELKLVLVDPKQVELSVYDAIEKPYLAHLDGMSPICTTPEDAKETLEAVIRLMEDRYTMLKEKGVRNIQEYNATADDKLPYYVVVIDEYGDLILQGTKEMEVAICRIAQKARAVGIHMIISTQRPDTKIVTGSIKANFPTRIAFRTTTGTDSRVILDRIGAERLTGKGDMLFFNGGESTRVQCAYTSTEDVISMCEEMKEEYDDRKPTMLPDLVSSCNQKYKFDNLYQETVDFLPNLVGKDYIDMMDIPLIWLKAQWTIKDQLFELGLIDSEYIKFEGIRSGYKVLVNDANEISRIAYSFYDDKTVIKANRFNMHGEITLNKYGNKVFKTPYGGTILL